MPIIVIDDDEEEELHTVMSVPSFCPQEYMQNILKSGSEDESVASRMYLSSFDSETKIRKTTEDVNFQSNDRKLEFDHFDDDDDESISTKNSTDDLTKLLYRYVILLIGFVLIGFVGFWIGIMLMYALRSTPTTAISTLEGESGVDAIDVLKLTKTEMEKDLSGISDPKLFSIANTPQSNALSWMLSNQPNSRTFLTQHYILAVFYYSLSGPIWAQSNITWLTSAPICTWDGIICSNTNGMVQSIDLPTSNLKGTIPNELCSLSFLQKLNLANNQISGPLPSNMTSHHKLQYLDLSHNQIKGYLPTSFHKMQALQHLDLSSNLIEGYIHDSISNIPYLKNLYLHTNLFSGILPLSFSNLKYLEALHIQDNSITGNLDSRTFSTLSNFSSLILSNNQFFGMLPAELPQLLPQLHQLRLDNNAFGGTLPLSYTQFHKLIELQIERTELSGTVPLGLCDIPSLNMSAECGGDDAKISCDCCTTCYSNDVVND